MSLSRIHLPATKACTQGINSFMLNFAELAFRSWWQKPIICLLVYADGTQQSFISCRQLLSETLDKWSTEEVTKH